MGKEVVGRLSDCEKVKETKEGTTFRCKDSKTGKLVTVTIPNGTEEGCAGDDDDADDVKEETKNKEDEKPPLGSGERFKELTKELNAKGAESPEALAAWIGRRKHGAAKMAKLAAAGRKG
jgi:hypothetical protein